MNKKLRERRSENVPDSSQSRNKIRQRAQNALTNTPILVVPRANEQYTVHTDAGDTRIGCVLLQKEEDGTGGSIE